MSAMGLTGLQSRCQTGCYLQLQMGVTVVSDPSNPLSATLSTVPLVSSSSSIQPSAGRGGGPRRSWSPRKSAWWHCSQIAHWVQVLRWHPSALSHQRTGGEDRVPPVSDIRSPCPATLKAESPKPHGLVTVYFQDAAAASPQGWAAFPFRVNWIQELWAS